MLFLLRKKPLPMIRLRNGTHVKGGEGKGKRDCGEDGEERLRRRRGRETAEKTGKRDCGEDGGKITEKTEELGEKIGVWGTGQRQIT